MTKLYFGKYVYNLLGCYVATGRNEMANCPLLDYEESSILYVRQLQEALSIALDALEPFAKIGKLESGLNVPIYAKLVGKDSASVSKFDFVKAAKVVNIAAKAQPNKSIHWNY